VITIFNEAQTVAMIQVKKAIRQAMERKKGANRGGPSLPASTKKRSGGRDTTQRSAGKTQIEDSADKFRKGLGFER